MVAEARCNTIATSRSVLDGQISLGHGVFCLRYSVVTRHCGFYYQKGKLKGPGSQSELLAGNRHPHCKWYLAAIASLQCAPAERSKYEWCLLGTSLSCKFKLDFCHKSRYQVVKSEALALYCQSWCMHDSSLSKRNALHSQSSTCHPLQLICSSDGLWWAAKECSSVIAGIFFSNYSK